MKHQPNINYVMKSILYLAFLISFSVYSQYDYEASSEYPFGRLNPDCVQIIDFIEDSLVYYDDFLYNKYNFDIQDCFKMKLEYKICDFKKKNFFN